MGFIFNLFSLTSLGVPTYFQNTLPTLGKPYVKKDTND
jgi:hypothetical protein